MVKVLRFYADWCAPCKRYEPVFERTMAEFKGIDNLEVLSYNVEEESELADKFGVTSIPAVIILKDEDVLFKAGGPRPAHLTEMVNEALA